LIDCGTLGAVTTGLGLKDVAQEIISTVGPGGLDLLIATHEHWDHVAGFKPESRLFAGLKVKRVWLAWTEDPRDPDAKRLATKKGDLAAKLQLAGAALTHPAADEASEQALAAVQSVLGFNGGPLGVDGISESVNAAMEAVRTGFGAAVEYRHPGESKVDHDWLPGFRIYTLGPPRDDKWLERLGEHGSGDIYGVSPGVRAALGESVDPADNAEDHLPFASRWGHSIADPQAKAWCTGYFAGNGDWRRIDSEWLNSTAQTAERLALQLDNITNNTSLALAIERVADGKVLLFPADAQEGNWLSWHEPDMGWNVPDSAGRTSRVSAADLLRRTVFYKVGHHASHNATASVKGLELMNGAGLTAFIPVDRAVALSRNPKGSWQMPARKLYRRLLEKCQGRVLRSDLGWAAPVINPKKGHPEEEFKDLADPAEWTKWQKAQSASGVNVTDKYIEFILT
jgi:hypothetical protein